MRSSTAWIAAASLSFAVLLAVMVRLAWLSDDSYITLRTVENWLAGHGPVWNVGERVQTYTHPLWMLLLTAARATTGEHYFTTIGLGLVLSTITALLLARLAGGAVAATAVLALLIGSRAFGDFSTSGLESPLVFLLLALLAIAHGSELAPLRRLFCVALLTGLLATTRMDLGLLCAPALLANARGLPRLRAALAGAAGLLPFGLWCAFAALYYGTPFPITAYAKAIAVGVDPLALLRQGLCYFVYVAANDPLTVAVVAAGCTLGLLRAELRSRALALGVLLYCAYVAKVGGDFMHGRFFAPPFVAALTIVARALAFDWPPASRAVRVSGIAAAVVAFAMLIVYAQLGKLPDKTVFAPPESTDYVRFLLVLAAALPLFARTLAGRAQLTVVAAAALALAPGLPPWLRAPAADQPPTSGFLGIIDERRFYYWQLGLLSPQRSVPAVGGMSAMLRKMGRTKPGVFPHGQVGRYAFEAGDLVHMVDPWLCDPLLMRLPVWDTKGWRIGHFIRRIPEGYLESVAAGTNRIVHPGLRRYYDALHTVITEPVFGEERLRVLWQFWRGAFDGDLATFVNGDQDDSYRHPPRVRVPAGELAHPQPPQLPWFDQPTPRVIYEGGIAVQWAQPVTATKLRLQLIGNITYKLSFRRGDQELATATVDTAGLSAFSGDPWLHEKDADVPAAAAGFTSIWIDALNPTSEHVGCIGCAVPVP